MIWPFKRAAKVPTEAARADARKRASLALECQARGDLEGAVEGYEASLALDPGSAEVHNNLGNLYRGLGRLEDAEAAFRLAIEADARLAEAPLNLAMLLAQTGRARDAVALCRKALALRPRFPEASQSLGFLLEQEGDLDGAMQCYGDALAARPDYPEARFGLALQQLLRGDYANGWRDYEWRMRLPGHEGVWSPGGRPAWDGAPLEGRTILLFAEQGFGDVIQFVRYAPLVAARGGKVILSCQPKLKALLGTVPGLTAIFGTAESLPPFDLSCSLLSLPRVFGTTLDTVPAQVPYLRVDTERELHWKRRLAADAPSLKVGLFWATGTGNIMSPQRTLSLDMLAPLAGITGISYYSLQRGEAASQAAHPPRGMKLIDLAAELGDFADDAALMANLDLIISINTATAHLAGALGRPVWTLVQSPPDWRWLLGRDDSPWYPTMRLFRRGQAETWGQVVERIGQALRQLA